MDRQARKGWLDLAPEVADAVAERRPIVALESTVIAQGLPWPRNLQTARELENLIRMEGAVPATIAVIDGVARVGLSGEEIEDIARAPGVTKLSTRDLPVAIARGGTGATTVAATVHVAREAGIDVFATGGIGGVHRGLPPDVSADLPQLQRSRMIVVCSGAKSILDLPATRELLEMLGVLVLGFETDVLPAFYTRESDLEVDARVDSARDVAEIWRHHVTTGLNSAILLCVPIPHDASIAPDRMEGAISAALAHATEHGIRGKEVTPFLLARLGMATSGASIDANVALLRNNARIAAAVAVEVAGV